MLIPNLGYRQVTMRINKQEQFTPSGANLLNCLLSYANIGGIQIQRDKSRKLNILNSTERDYDNFRFRLWLIV